MLRKSTDATTIRNPNRPSITDAGAHSTGKFLEPGDFALSDVVFLSPRGGRERENQRVKEHGDLSSKRDYRFYIYLQGQD